MVTSAISAFVGTNGGGKSLAAVEQAVIPAVEEGRVIVGNLRLQVPDFKLLRSWRELVRVGVHLEPSGPARLGPRGERVRPEDRGYSDDLPIYSLTENRPVLVMLDEITACLPSRSYSSMPTQLQRVLNQLRKQDTTLVWTAPNWARCDVLLREVTQRVTVCRGYLPDRYAREDARGFRPAVKRDEDGQKIRNEGGWRPRRLFKWTTYDAVDFESFTEDDQIRIRPMGKRYYWRTLHHAQHVYDTYESVQLLDHLDDLGTCIGCGGKRSQARCSCTPLEQDHNHKTKTTTTGRKARSAEAGPLPSPSLAAWQ